VFPWLGAAQIGDVKPPALLECLRRVEARAERLDVAESVIEAQLAHPVPDASGRAYNRTEFLGQRRRMMQLWADYLDILRRGDTNAEGCTVRLFDDPTVVKIQADPATTSALAFRYYEKAGLERVRPSSRQTDQPCTC
jgi:hypothetical protein